MKHERLKNCIVGGVLAFVTAWGSVGGLASGFQLDVDSTGLALFCLLISAAFAGCLYTAKGGWLLMGVGAVTAGYLWHSGDLLDQMAGLLGILTRRYDAAYGIGVLGETGGDVAGALECFSVLIVLAVTYVVCRRKNAAPAVAAALVPLALCLVVTDTVPEAGYLFLLFFGLTLLIMTNHLRRQDPAQSVTLSWMLSIPLALGLGLLFVLMPREGYDNHPRELRAWIVEVLSDMPDSLGELGSELAQRLDGDLRAEEVDLTKVGPRHQRDNPVMDVVAPVSGVLYLREQDYDFYDGTNWESSARRTEEFGIAGIRPDWPEVGNVTIATRRTRELLFLPYYPEESFDLVGGRVENEAGDSAYEFTLYDLPPNWHSIATEPAAYDTNLVFTDGTFYYGDRHEGAQRRYLVLPEESRPKLEALAQQILTDEISATEKAETLAAYVRSSARYDLNTGRMPEEEADFALWFLEDSDTGYCVHFATATAVLLRAAGVESRYVTGYMVDARANEPVTVTGAEAHAWVEYYEPRLDAWIVLEATPGDLTDPPETEPTTEATESNSTTQPTTQAGSEPDPGKPEEEGGQVQLTWVMPVLLGLGVLSAVLVLPVRRWVHRAKLRKKSRTGPNAHALVLYARGEALAAYLKLRPAPELEDLARKARFSQHILSHEELGKLEDYVAELTKLCRKKNWAVRLIQKYWHLLY